MDSDEDEEATPFNISIQDLSTEEENEDTSNKCDIVLTRMDLVEEMRKSGHSFIDAKQQQKVLSEFLKSKLSSNDKNIKAVEQLLEEKVRIFLCQIFKKYNKSCRKYERFLKSHEDFLSKTFDLTDAQTPALTTRQNKGMFHKNNFLHNNLGPIP